MMRKYISLSGLVLSAISLTWACGSDDDEGGTEATGGYPGTGGFPGSGGMVATGGVGNGGVGNGGVGNGGTVSTGGVGNGGTVSTGGIGAGGGPATGGVPVNTGGVGSGGDMTTGGAGGATGGAGGSTGGSGGSTGGGGSADCYCRGAEPTEQTATANGPYAPQSYTSGFKDGSKFGAATIYYPTGDAAPPFAGVVICPGFTALQNSIAGWGPFLASHGIVTMTIDTNTTGDSVVLRADALMDALDSLKGENTRSGSPLNGKLSPDRFGLMGWSMGGGGTWIASAKNGTVIKTAISLAGHILTGGGAAAAQGLSIPTFFFVGATDTPILGGGGQSQSVYDIMPATSNKILYQIAAAGHDVGNNPRNTSGAVGRYGLSFQKVFLEKDERYRKFLLTPGPGNNEWRSTVK